MFSRRFVGFRWFLWYSVFSKVFLVCKNLGENRKTKTKKTNPYPRVGLKPLNTLFLVFPKVFWFSLVFFSILGFSKVFWFCKNFGENKENISKGGSETFKNFVVLFSLRCCWFSFVCLVFSVFLVV